MKILSLLIWIIAIIGLIGVSQLLFQEIAEGGACPIMLGVPACYIIFSCFMLAILGHSGILKSWSWLYFAGVGIGLAFGTYSSLGELFGYFECPKLGNGFPKCVISFSIFFSLLVLKLVQLRLKKRRSV